MSAGKSSVSNAGSYREIGEYWDSHEVTDENSEPVEMEVDLQRPKIGETPK